MVKYGIVARKETTTGHISGANVLLHTANVSCMYV